MTKKPKRIPVAKDPDRLTKPAARALARIADRTLHKEFTDDKRSPSGVYYFTEPGGRRVDNESAEELIFKGRVQSLNDGLFSECGQSFRVPQ